VNVLGKNYPEGRPWRVFFLRLLFFPLDEEKRYCMKIPVFQLDKFFLKYGMELAMEKANGNRKRMAREYNLLNCVDILL